jgi:hypothetical protein
MGLAVERPARLDQLDPGAGARVRRAHLMIEFEPKPGTVGDREAPIGRRDGQGLVDQFRRPGVGEVVEGSVPTTYRARGRSAPAMARPTMVVCRSTIFFAACWSSAVAPHVSGAVVCSPVSRSGR